MNDIDQINKILDEYPRHLHRLILLLGTQALCKATGSNSLEDLVNSKGINPRWFETLAKEIYYNDGFEQHLSGDLFNTLMDIHFFAENIPSEPLKGSIEYYLNLRNQVKEMKKKNGLED